MHLVVIPNFELTHVFIKIGLPLLQKVKNLYPFLLRTVLWWMLKTIRVAPHCMYIVLEDVFMRSHV